MQILQTFLIIVAILIIIDLFGMWLESYLARNKEKDANT